MGQAEVWKSNRTPKSERQTLAPEFQLLYFRRVAGDDADGRRIGSTYRTDLQKLESEEFALGEVQRILIVGLSPCGYAQLAQETASDSQNIPIRSRL